MDLLSFTINEPGLVIAFCLAKNSVILEFVSTLFEKSFNRVTLVVLKESIISLTFLDPFYLMVTEGAKVVYAYVFIPK